MILEKFETHEAWISALNKRAISGQELLSELVANRYIFYKHPLGFLMCRLGRWGKSSLRVHIWPNHDMYAQKPTWLIHNHVFSLKSWVLLGEIENIEYGINYSGSEYSVYEATYNDEKSRLNKTKQSCSAQVLKSFNITEGGIYSIKAGKFHQSSSSLGKISLTVCETEDALETPPRVLGDIDGNNSYTYSRYRASEKDLKTIIDAYNPLNILD